MSTAEQKNTEDQYPLTNYAKSEIMSALFNCAAMDHSCSGYGVNCSALDIADLIIFSIENKGQPLATASKLERLIKQISKPDPRDEISIPEILLKCARIWKSAGSSWENIRESAFLQSPVRKMRDRDNFFGKVISVIATTYPDQVRDGLEKFAETLTAPIFLNQNEALTLGKFLLPCVVIRSEPGQTKYPIAHYTQFIKG